MQMKYFKSVAFLAITLLLTACPYIHQRIKYPVGHVPEMVVNFTAINSAYDDYNSTLPIIFGQHFLQFSSNRNSYGNDFDIIGRNLNISWDQETGNFDISAAYPISFNEFMQPMLDSLNSDCNELGPMGFVFLDQPENFPLKFNYLLMFAHNCSGNYDLQFADAVAYDNVRDCTYHILPPVDIDFVNSDANELYPTLFGEHVSLANEWLLDVKKFTGLIFCSDRAGSYDLFQAEIPYHENFLESLSSEDTAYVASLNINSSADDKCPYVYGNVMVFASDRGGGFGGFDLYFSQFTDGEWSAPKNLGLGINTEFDEYRPIISRFDGFDNYLMIFSSNRPEGMGGFDLYYTGLNFNLD